MKSKLDETQKILDKTLEMEGCNLQSLACYQSLHDEHDNLFFEGDVKNDKANGKGRLYYPNGVVEYEGHFYDNMLDGVGSLYSEIGNLLYEGMYKSGFRNGYGVEYYHTGAKLYEGDWIRDKWHGVGRWYNILEEIIYHGEFEFGFPKNSKKKFPKENYFKGDHKLEAADFGNKDILKGASI